MVGKPVNPKCGNRHDNTTCQICLSQHVVVGSTSTVRGTTSTVRTAVGGGGQCGGTALHCPATASARGAAGCYPNYSG